MNTPAYVIAVHAWLEVDGDQTYCDPDHPHPSGWSVYVRDENNHMRDDLEDEDYKHREVAMQRAQELADKYPNAEIREY